MAKKEGVKVLAENRKAFHNYHILQRMEAGIELSGTEVKSIRQGKFNLSDSYAQVKNGELYLIGMYISPYEEGNRFNKDPLRTRRLLMHKREINRLFDQVRQEGLTLVPTRVYLKDSRVKIELAVAKGKKDYDKRESIKERETDRQMRQAVKGQGRYSDG